ncbi:unnamed protein product, partial [Musa acuminata subsp. burmannicoides]
MLLQAHTTPPLASRTLFGQPRWPIPTEVLFPRPDSSWTVAPPFHWMRHPPGEAGCGLGKRVPPTRRVHHRGLRHWAGGVQWGGRSAADHAHRVNPAGLRRQGFLRRELRRRLQLAGVGRSQRGAELQQH